VTAGADARGRDGLDSFEVYGVEIREGLTSVVVAEGEKSGHKSGPNDHK